MTAPFSRSACSAAGMDSLSRVTSAAARRRGLRLALGPQPADLPGQAVAPGLHLLQRLLQPAALLIEFENRGRLGRQPTAPQPLVEGARIIANGFQVVHLPTSRKIRVQGYRLGDS